MRAIDRPNPHCPSLTYRQTEGAPSFRSRIAEGWETTDLMRAIDRPSPHCPSLTYRQTEGAPSFRSRIAEGWETTDLMRAIVCPVPQVELSLPMHLLRFPSTA
jgi:hypothetical protein